MHARGSLGGWLKVPNKYSEVLSEWLEVPNEQLKSLFKPQGSPREAQNINKKSIRIAACSGIATVTDDQTSKNLLYRNKGQPRCHQTNNCSCSRFDPMNLYIFSGDSNSDNTGSITPRNCRLFPKSVFNN